MNFKLTGTSCPVRHCQFSLQSICHIFSCASFSYSTLLVPFCYYSLISLHVLQFCFFNFEWNLILNLIVILIFDLILILIFDLILILILNLILILIFDLILILIFDLILILIFDLILILIFDLILILIFDLILISMFIFIFIFILVFILVGCYIPVMPLNMVEILDAPVPFLIGVHGQYLKLTPKERRPQSVVFVDLQNDIVDLGSTCELYGTDFTPRVVEPLSKQVRTKLKGKLDEYGGCIYKQKNHVDKLKTAGVAFPHHEQLNPITDFQSNSALSQSNHASRPSSPSHRQSLNQNNSQSPPYSPSKGSLSPSQSQGAMHDNSGDSKHLSISLVEKLLLNKGPPGGKYVGNGKLGEDHTGDNCP